MSQSGGFDMSKMSTASRILIFAGALYIIDLFLPWQSEGSVSVSGTHGIGVLNLLLAIALVAWEVMAGGTDQRSQVVDQRRARGRDRALHDPEDHRRQ